MNGLQKLISKLEQSDRFSAILNENAPAYINSVAGLVASNNLLSKADPNTVYTAVIVAASLGLSIDPSLGHAYIVPYKESGGGIRAQFQLGYKGLIQLALRSGHFRTINSFPVGENELVEYNIMRGNRYDFKLKNKGDILGYGAFFELTSGFSCELFMTVEDIRRHASRFSQSFRSGNGPWIDDFGQMAEKTVLKLLLSRRAPISINDNMHRAIVADQSVIIDDESMEVYYPDNKTVSINEHQQAQERDRVISHINNSSSLDELFEVDELIERFELDEIYAKKTEDLKQKQ